MMAARRVLLLGAIAVVGARASAGPAAAEPLVTAAPKVRAIEPTTSGQIGINPVTSDLGSPDEYQLTDLGPSNPVITYQGNTYHYIEGHTKYLTIETITTTVDNKPTTTTSEVKVIAATATADSGAQKAGDIALTFSEDVANALRATADDAIQACGLVAKKRNLIGKRIDSVSCIIDRAVKASGENGPLSAVQTEEFWSQLSVDVAANAPKYLASAVAVLSSQAQKNQALIILTTIIVGTKIAGPLAAVNIPKAGVGSATSLDNSSNGTPVNGKCDPSKDANKNSPLCSDADCLGKPGGRKDGRCTVGGPEKKDCACLLEGHKQAPQEAAKDLWDEQQNVIGKVAADPKLLGAAAPSCFVNDGGQLFDGKPAADPPSWCVCNVGGKNLIYPTMSESSSSPCAFTATPSATISIKIGAPSVTGPITSCRTSTVSGASPTGGPYCTCNDNSMYPLDTWTQGGSATTGCSATRSMATSTAAAKPTATCNPSKPFSINQDSFIGIGEKFCADNANKGLRSMPVNPYSNGLLQYFKDGASKGGQVYMFAYLDKDCKDQRKLDENDCKAAVHSIFDRCDVNQGQRQGGAASINCQWLNITAVDSCMGSQGSFENPGSCNVGYVPPSYQGWPLGTVQS